MYNSSVVLYHQPSIYNPFNFDDFYMSNLSVEDYINNLIKKEEEVYKVHREALMSEDIFPQTMPRPIVDYTYDTRKNETVTKIGYGLEEHSMMCRKSLFNVQFYKTYLKLYNSLNLPIQFLEMIAKRDRREYVGLYKDKERYKYSSAIEREEMLDGRGYMEKIFINGEGFNSNSFFDFYKQDRGTHNSDFVLNYNYLVPIFKKALYSITRKYKKIIWSNKVDKLSESTYVFFGEIDGIYIKMLVDFVGFSIEYNKFGSDISVNAEIIK